MTDIATVKENRSIYPGESGKTSPLSTLPTSSPSLLKPNHDQMTIESIDTSISNNSTSKQLNGTEARSKSIASDESSDLSDLDSDAETEKMYNGEESQLAKLSKNSHTNTTITNDDDATIHQDNDTFIKDGVLDELKTEKDGDVEIEANEEIGKVVEDLKNSEEPEEPKLNGNHERAIEEDDQDADEEDEDHAEEEDATKPLKRKLTDNNTEESTKRAKIDQPNSKNDEPNGGDHEVDNEGEDEDEEEELEEEEEGEDELTEEQKLQKQKDLELELEKQKQRKEAIQFLTEIEIDFAKLRDRLYDDKMERFKSELAMCLNGSHPELQSVYTKIDAHREERIRLASSNQKYKLQCIDRQTRATRTSIHQQYFKRISDFKTKYLNKITEDWYEINKERRTLDLLVPDYSYKIPEYTDELINQREQLNQEISLLVGLKQYYGFPKAPKLSAIEGNELDNDLRAMNLL